MEVRMNRAQIDFGGSTKKLKDVFQITLVVICFNASQRIPARVSFANQFRDTLGGPEGGPKGDPKGLHKETQKHNFVDSRQFEVMRISETMWPSPIPDVSH